MNTWKLRLSVERNEDKKKKNQINNQYSYTWIQIIYVIRKQQSPNKNDERGSSLEI